MSTAPRLAVHDLTARYGSIVAIRDIELRVDPGEIVSLLGANGAGKTTTLTSIAGLVPGMRGKIELDGRDVTESSPEDLVGLG